VGEGVREPLTFALSGGPAPCHIRDHRIPAGTDVSSGTCKCTNCDYELKVGSTKNLPLPQLW
jgi:hypothetical protein